MKKKKLAIYAGVAILSLGTLYNFKINKDVKFIKAKSMSIEQTHNPKISIVAHRGFSSMEIGNSKEAIEASTSLDCVSGIEFDVRLTKDEELVLSHGDKIRDNNNNWSINNSNLEELRDIKLKVVNSSFIDTLQEFFSLSEMSCVRFQRMHDLKYKTGTIVTLDETMDIIDNKKMMYIELKFNDNYEELSSKVVEVLKSHPATDFIIQCNNYKEIKKMQKMYPQYQYQIIISNAEELPYLDEDFDGYAIKYNLINYDIVKQKIDADKEISIWNINYLEEFEDIVDEMGKYKERVNYITDYPDYLCYQYTK